MDYCFSAGMYLRIEMRYMPTGGALQVFLQNVTMLLLSMRNRVGGVM